MAEMEVLNITAEDLNLPSVDEEIVRDVHFAPYSFRGPEGWEQMTDPNGSGVLYVMTPGQDKALVVFGISGIAFDMDDEATRKEKFDNLMTNYNGTAYGDVGNIRLGYGNLNGLPAVIYIRADGHDLVVIAYVEESTEYEPRLSDIIPYIRTVVHD